MEPSYLPVDAEKFVNTDFIEYVENIEKNQREHHRAMLEMVKILGIQLEKRPTYEQLQTEILIPKMNYA